MTKANRKNIIFVFIESFDGRKIGFWGNPALQNATPNMDQIAHEGAIFSNCYTANPICCPSRSCLWTGSYTFRHESWNNYKGLQPGTRRFQHVLEQEGYTFASEKGGIGKHDYESGHHTVFARTGAWTGPLNVKKPLWHKQAPKIAEKWKFWMRKTNKMDWFSLRRAKRFLKKQGKKGAGKRSDPFFLYLSLVLPHPKYYTHAKWFDKIDDEVVSIPKEDQYEHPVNEYQKVLKNWEHGFDEKTVKKTRAVYYAMISETDAIIGEVKKTLEKLGLYDDSYLVISADHGDNQLEHRQILKSNMFESAAKVPLIVRGPGILPGKVYDNNVDITDFFPTFLDMAGLPTTNIKQNFGLDYPLDGESFLPLILGKNPPKKDFAFSMYTAIGTNTSQFMLKKGNWKYIAYPGYEPLLFNLKENPGETINYAPKNPDVVEELDKSLREIVEYEKIHDKYIDYCKQSLRRFEKECENGEIRYKKFGERIRNASFQEVLKALYEGWNENDMKKLRQFIE